MCVCVSFTKITSEVTVTALQPQMNLVSVKYKTFDYHSKLIIIFLLF